MGYSLGGLAPTSAEGRHFRASLSGWSGYLAVIATTEVLPDELLTAMSYNEGAGPSREQAERLATALDELVPEYEAGRIEPDDGFWTPETWAMWCEDLREFARFCRASGGFRVT